MSNEQADLLRDFADEALSSLRSLPSQLESYRLQPSAEPINAVFRGIHSLKGNAGFFGLTAIKSFAHSVENTLDKIRAELTPISAELQRLLITAFDRLDEMVTAAGDGAVAHDLAPDERALLQEIATHADAGKSSPDDQESVRQLLQILSSIQVPGLDTPTEWLEAVLDTQVEDIQRRRDRRPDTAAAKTPEKPTPASLAGSKWNCPALELADSVSDILRLFTAFEEGSYSEETAHTFVHAAEKLAADARRARRESLAVALESAVRNFRLVTSGPIPLDGLLLSVVWDELWPELSKLAAPEQSIDAAQPTAVAPSAVAARPLPTEATAKKEPEKSGRLVRVKEERLDDFLNLVARLFITGEMFKDLQGRMAESRQLKPMVEEFREIIRSFSEQAHVLQKGLFSLRRLPVANLFTKFPGMARGLARQLGKEIDVQLLGEEVEIDKVLIEDLDAPLTHIIRNAVDHGIDGPDARRARGAAECGKLTLKAEVTRTHVRILISDDGRGIDPNKLRAKALEKRLYTEAELSAMSDDEAVQLIFHPGFSTAEKLSDVSGRGVGLDVVRNSVRKHRGEVYVQSQVNVGTTFRLEVPLREAVLVIDGLMIRHDGEEFVIPFEFIREITQLEPGQLSPLHGAEAATIRDTVYDARRLSAVLDNAPSTSGGLRPLSAVVVGTQYGRLCLLVDQVLGTRKVVVNGLKDIVKGSTSIAGVAQLGGGRLALVLGIPEIVNKLIVSASREAASN